MKVFVEAISFVKVFKDYDFTVEFVAVCELQKTQFDGQFLLKQVDHTCLQKKSLEWNFNNQLAFLLLNTNMKAIFSHYV